MFVKNSQACPHRPLLYTEFPLNRKPVTRCKISTLFACARLGRYPDNPQAHFTKLQIVQTREEHSADPGIWQKKILFYFSAGGIRRFATVY
ncbi:hypothetical protein [Paenibacillus sp. FSL M7-0896]|uniref:hypothetical protein n=1 Tax=Paenibacillus sp. FSL M7-0896 TaxID=2921610 RepID=UPI0030DD54FD